MYLHKNDRPVKLELVIEFLGICSEKMNYLLWTKITFGSYFDAKFY